MVFSAFRKAPLAIALMLGCAALPAQAGWFSSDNKPAQKAESKPAGGQPAASAANLPATNLPATNLEDSIRQAQLLRLAAQYPEAIKHLSQLMMVASDDPRVISEYGKTLASMGRASDAVNFLTRAQQLQPTDWTIYSAIGVAYDQLGDQKNAQDAYEHALSLKPDEPSVLSNYAFSRMLAKDPEMARKLAARAESAGGANDVKIARNIAMIRSLAAETPEPAPAAMAAQSPTASDQTQMAKTAQQVHAPESHDNRVVMQRVPVDPQAGPVASAKPVTATHAPRPLLPQLAADATHPESNVTAGLPTPKPVTTQPLPPPVAPVKAAEVKPAPAGEAAKPATTTAPLAKVTPTPIKTAETVKPTAPVTKLAPPAAAQAATLASASVTLRLAPPLKGEADKPAQPPKVLPPGPLKAGAKPANPGAVPGLRVTANAY